MEKIKIKLTGMRLEAICSTFLGIALSTDLTRAERAKKCLFVEGAIKLQKKSLDAQTPNQIITISLKYYEADVLETYLRDWSYTNERDYWYSLVMVVADELHQKLT